MRTSRAPPPSPRATAAENLGSTSRPAPHRRRPVDPYGPRPVRAKSGRSPAAPAAGHGAEAPGLSAGQWLLALTSADDVPAVPERGQGRVELPTAVARSTVLWRGPGAGPEILADESHLVLLDGEPRSGPPAGGPAAEVLRLYRHGGSDALGDLRGRFACVLVDGRLRRAAALRDPLGLHPLFWAWRHRTLLLAPGLDVLLRAGGVPPELDPAALAGFLCQRWPGPGETYYRHARRVRPGHVLETSFIRSPAAVRERRYWRPEIPDDDGWLPDGEAGRFPELLATAVDRAAADRRAGVSLSSGLDSVSVAVAAAGAAALHGRRRPPALCLGFTFPDCDERADQRRVATALGMPVAMVPVELAATGEAGPLHELLTLAPRLPAPPVNPLLPSFLRLRAAAVQRGCRVLLTGNGGDEWAGVSPFLAADLLRDGRWRDFWRLGRSIQRSVTLPAWVVWRNQLWRFAGRPLLAASLASRAPGLWTALRHRRSLRRLPSWLPSDGRLRRQLAERWTSEPADAAPQSFYQREVERSVDHCLASMTHEESHVAARLSGLAVRSPFEDDEMVEFLYRLRPEQLLHGGRSKGLLREYLGRRLPAMGFQGQRKVSFTRFFHQMTVREGAACLRRLGGFPALHAAGVAEGDALARSVERTLERGPGPHTVDVWSALVLESWLRRELTP